MSESFNRLTPAEAERLAYFLEELGECQQAIGKILRHGYESRNPDDENHINNRFELEREIADVLGAIELLYRAEDIDREYVKNFLEDKKYRYLHHQDEIQ